MSFRTGVQAFIDGARLSRDPDLLRFTWIPALVSLLIIGSGTWLAFDTLSTWGQSLSDRLPSWLGFLEWVLVPLLYLLGLVLGVWLFGLLAGIIASPFLGSLSLAVERKVWGRAPEDTTAWWRLLGPTLARELRKLLYHLPRLLVVFVLTLIPLVNAAAPVIWLLFGAWTMAVQFADYPVENRQRPFRDTLARLKARPAAALGFGACTALVLAIPLLNFVLIPVAVCGGTLLWRYLEDVPTRSDAA